MMVKSGCVDSYLIYGPLRPPQSGGYCVLFKNQSRDFVAVDPIRKALLRK
jgi:hypothetical protein